MQYSSLTRTFGLFIRLLAVAAAAFDGDVLFTFKQLSVEEAVAVTVLPVDMIVDFGVKADDFLDDELFFSSLRLLSE